MEWRVRGRNQLRGYGEPTEANLSVFVRNLNASLAPGESNAHIGPDGFIVKASIVRQSDGEALATATFETPEPPVPREAMTPSLLAAIMEGLKG